MITPALQKKTKPLKKAKEQLEELGAVMQLTQQAMWAQKKRAVIVFEGFDAAGKGTCIRHLTDGLDPRSMKVVPIGAPTTQQKGQHYLQRFWKELPDAGCTTVFDRSWYGRVLVEKVEKLAPAARLEAAYKEINLFEKMLKDDGVVVIKIFLVVSKSEQLKRFKARLEEPRKNWKITEEDVRNRKRWNDYVKAADMLAKRCPGWTVIPSDDKDYARVKVLEAVTEGLKDIRKSFKPDTKQVAKLVKALLNS
jgi:polyphosphate kinase 2 (PPK2 family)